MTTTVTTMHPSDTTEDAGREMDLANIRHLPIVDRERRLVGIVSERDLSRVQAQRGQPTPLRDLMRADVVTVAPDTPLTEAAYLLLRQRIGSLPVCEGDGTLVGIVTETDFVRLAYELLGGADLEDRAREERESEHI